MIPPSFPAQSRQQSPALPPNYLDKAGGGGLRLDGPSLLLLTILPLLLLGRQIILGGAIYDVDMMLMSVPVYSWYAEQLKQGILPIWTPAVMGGAPIAFAIYAFFYPPDMLLYLLMDGARAFHLSLALHVALAGVLTYCYCRLLGYRRLPSLLAAVAFEMGTQVLTWQSNGAITRTLFVLPGLLAAIEAVFRWRPSAWLAVPIIVGAGLLGGYAQVVLFGLAVGGLYALVLAAARLRHLGPRDAFGRLALLAVGVALGFGLAAVRTLPTLAFLEQTTRGEAMGLARSAVDSIEPWALVLGYLLPAATEIPGIFATRPDYMGAPILILVVLAAASPRSLGRVGWFHLVLGAGTVLLSLGEYTPLYGLLLKLPFFSLFRGPDRLSSVAALALAVLAAHSLNRGLPRSLPRGGMLYRGMVVAGAAVTLAGILGLGLSAAFQFPLLPGLDEWRAGLREEGWDTLNLLRPRVAVPALGLVLTIWLALWGARGRISGRMVESSLVFITGATLFVLAWVHNPWMPPSVLQEPPEAARAVLRDPEPYRVFSWAPGVSTYNVGAFYAGQVGFPPSREFQGQYFRSFIPPNVGIMFGIDHMEWYDALQTRRQALLAAYLGSERRETARYANGDTVDWDLQGRRLTDRIPLLQTVNVGYLTSAFPVEDPRLELVTVVSQQIYPHLPAEAKVHLYRVKDAMPRTFLVPEARYLPDEKLALDAMLAGKNNPRREVVLEVPSPALVSSPLTSAGSAVEGVDYGNEMVSVLARTDGSGYLVLMDFMMEGWTAEVDGRRAEILEANFAGRAVVLDGPGEHRVEFRYRAPWYREGVMASLASSLVLLSTALATWLRRPRLAPGRPEDAPPYTAPS